MISPQNEGAQTHVFHFPKECIKKQAGNHSTTLSRSCIVVRKIIQGFLGPVEGSHMTEQHSISLMILTFVIDDRNFTGSQNKNSMYSSSQTDGLLSGI